MSQENETELHPNELEALKSKATFMGITFHPNIGVDTLRAKIHEKLSGEIVKSESPVDETEGQRRSRIAKKARSLVRCVIHCADPSKREWPGEVFTVSNSLVGTIKRYIPYGSESPTHIEQLLLNTLLEKRVAIGTSKPGKNGVPRRIVKSIPAFNITVMPALTPDELQNLAKNQAVRNATSDDE